MNERKVYEWVECFEVRRTRVMDKRRSNCRLTSCAEEYVQRVDSLIREDRRFTLSQVVAIVTISSESVQAIMHDDFEYHKDFTR